MSRLLLVMLLVFSAGLLAEPRDPYQHFFNESWGDFKEELVNAREQNKKAILVFFEMDDCPFCHYMKTHVLNQPQVQAYFREHFLNFAMDIEGDIEIVDFAGGSKTQKQFSTKDNRVRATPVFGFFDLQGKPIARFTGKTSSIDEFMLLGKFVAEGHYKNMRFIQYKRQQSKS